MVSKELKISRNQAINLIKDALVIVNDKEILKPSFKANPNDKICVNFAEAKPQENRYEVKFDVPIIYEDENLLVLNKPAGVVVHGANSLKEASLVEWLNEKSFMLSNLNGAVRAGIVHRLDRETSGAIVVAKTNLAHAKLSEQLSDKSMGRIYLAMVDLALKSDCILDRPIARSPANRLKNAVVANGKPAKTAFRNLCEGKNANLIACKLFTGRTHQIRVHLSSINRHILGDNLYGFKSEKDRISRIMLHAYLMYFTHPITGEKLEFVAPLYDDFKNLAYKKFQMEDFDEKIKPSHIHSIFSDLSDCVRL